MTKKTNDKSSIFENDNISNGLIKNIKVHTNLAQDVVVTTEDKIRICLINYLSKMEKKSTWVAPASILLTIVITLLTSQFNNFYLNADTWTAIFTISAILSGLWLLRSLKNAFTSVKIDNVIDELKKGSPVKKDTGQIIYVKSNEALIEIQNQDKDGVDDSGLRILKAKYGIQEKNIDITEKLNSLIDDNKLMTVVNNALVDTDPVPGIKKVLNIAYAYRGEEHTKNFNEGENISLP